MYARQNLSNNFCLLPSYPDISRSSYMLSPDQSIPMDGPLGPGGSPHVVVECLKQSIRALVPTTIAQQYGLGPEDITLEDRDCTSVEYSELGYMLETQLSACGTTMEERTNKRIYRNRVRFIKGLVAGSGTILPRDHNPTPTPTPTPNSSP